MGLHIPDDPGYHLLHPSLYLALHGGGPHDIPCQGEPGQGHRGPAGEAEAPPEELHGACAQQVQ